MQWDRLKAEQEREELQQCTFAPAVKGGREGHTPLHRRLDDLQRQRRCGSPHSLSTAALWLSGRDMTPEPSLLRVLDQAA